MNSNTTMSLLIPLLNVLAMLTVSCAYQGKGPAGLTDGKLAPCPGSPNCVSSEEASEPSRIEPLIFTGNPEAAWDCLKRAVLGMGGTIGRDEDDYLWATFKTSLFRFVDDVEFRMDAPNTVIHVRSASRIGYSDFGVNRKRVETLRRRFSEEKGLPPT